MITRRDTLISLAAVAAAVGAPRVRADETKALPKLVETPMFEPLVKAGKLPPIAKRVPAAPLVARLAGDDKPGLHGGDLRILMSKDRDSRFVGAYGYARLVCWSPEYELVPDIAEAVDVDEANTTFTFKLRKGHRWSDGKPFTSEDFRFFWEDMANNKALGRYFGSAHLLVAGEKPKVEFPDAQTVRFSWSKPNPGFLPWLASPANLSIFRPAHYYKKFHEKYASKDRLKKLNEKRKDGWARKIATSDRRGRNDQNPDMPTLDPWIARTDGVAERFEFTRNPFYHRIDENGRQLPYVDRVVMVLAESKIIPVKTGAGEVDLQARGLRFDDFPFLRRSADERGFKVRLWKTANGAQLALYPNLNYDNPENPAWKGLLRDPRFRRGLSLAINRDEINKIMYVGLAEPGQNTVLSGSPLYKTEFRQAYAEFDLVRANRLLDQAGLTKRGPDGRRLLPDGRELELIVEYPAEGTEYIDLMRLVADTWAKVGIKTYSKAFQRVVLRRRVISGQTMMSVWGGIDYALVRPNLSPAEFVPNNEVQAQWPRWGQWVETRGKQGDKPDDLAALELLKLHHEWEAATSRQARRDLWTKILAINAEQVFSIGVVGGVLQPVVVNERLRNVPKEGIYAYDPGSYFGMYKPDTFWFDRAAAARPTRHG
ncbi:MAG: ABC transporter substrate-binding protein [Rhodospirillaceae bacterium]|nr:ABC transporter substrate-binding protein [Rhodospirillaceae bacterium]